jgi:hypothetical protein
VPDVPLLAKTGVVVLLAVSIARGFGGAPATAARPGAARALLVTAGALYLAAAVALAGGRAVTATLLAVVGLEAACASAWLARGDDDDGGDGGGGGGGAGGNDGPGGGGLPEDVPAIDWEAFDRARASWDRPRVTA